MKGQEMQQPKAAPPDPFANHPELRDKIVDPHRSFFREFEPASMDAEMAERGFPNWRLSDAQREATRREALADYPDGDLWVFAYGSLMWNPGFVFQEVRRADVVGYRRHFCLQDELGARGNRDAPGLMAALDFGGSCTGLAFRIAEDSVETETEILWKREMVAGAYVPAVIDAMTDMGPVKTIAFLANHTNIRIRPDISREEQVRFIGTGTGFLGSSLQYVEQLADHLEALGLTDEELFALLADARRYSAEAPSPK